MILFHKLQTNSKTFRTCITLKLLVRVSDSHGPRGTYEKQKKLKLIEKLGKLLEAITTMTDEPEEQLYVYL